MKHLVGLETGTGRAVARQKRATAKRRGMFGGRLYLTLKRLLDCTAAGIALALFTPVMAVIALAVRCSMGRPILFRQTRPGLNEKPFICLKFRTMRGDDAEHQRLNDSERLTAL